MNSDLEKIGMPYGSKDRKKNIVIILARHNNPNEEADYSLTISGNGRVVYEGKDNVALKETRTEYIPKSSIDKLINEFMNIYYFELKERYDESTSLDQPAVKTSITINGTTKSVFHVHGSRAPSALSRLEDKIDEITNSYQWTGRKK